jgi:hypothetical protein
MKTKKNKNVKNKSKKFNNIFKKKDYYSGEGMVTTIWGPPLWHYLHTMSFNYPLHPTPEEKKHYRNFIISLKYTLPCKHCRTNLNTNFKQLPLKWSDMKNRDTFSRYVYQLHQLINKMLNKTSFISYCEVRERYEHFRARCTDNKPKLFKFQKFTRKNSESGCVEPLYGTKSKCIINIVPQELKGESIQIDKKCLKTH